MVKKTAAPATDLAPWVDPGALTTEHDNALVADVMGGLKNLDTIQVASGLPYLGLDKSGSWKFGQDASEVQDGSYWAMDLPTAQWGFIAWVDGKPAGEVMVSIGQQRPMRGELDAGLPWGDQVAIEMVCVSGDDIGTRVVFKTSSVGGVKAFMAYKDAVKRAVPADPSKPIAVVQLETTKYQHSKYGQITNPTLKICGWSSMGILKAANSDQAERPAEEPVAPVAKPGASDRRRRVAS